MAALSIARGDKTRFVLAVNPVYVTSVLDFRTGAHITFEVLEADSSYLSELIGKLEYYSFDGGQPFWGKLLPLDPCQSTHQALAMLRQKPALRGVFLVVGEETGLH